ncbi:MAG: hypothetical protein CM1200mP41_12960 [Gammaproteobacteria bacterium]|nr:MAG: hypothetical protein CM1200mP41_12960 [Gammaproteobacteria bacterium]
MDWLSVCVVMWSGSLPAVVITEFEQKKLEAAQGQRELEALISELIEVNYAKAEDIAEF